MVIRDGEPIESEVVVVSTDAYALLANRLNVLYEGIEASVSSPQPDGSLYVSFVIGASDVYSALYFAEQLAAQFHLTALFSIRPLSQLGSLCVLVTLEEK